MTEIKTHHTNESNRAIKIHAVDDGEADQDCSTYALRVRRVTDRGDDTLEFVEHNTHLNFQRGPVSDEGTNGITNEALLAVILDRLERFQRGPYSCRENALAITKLQEAMHWLDHRTREREARGVEGTNEV